MNRREMLLGGAAVVSVATAGCLTSLAERGGSPEDDGPPDTGDQSGSDSDIIEEEPRVDEPPHTVPEPSGPILPDREERHTIVAEHMATEPSAPFEVFPEATSIARPEQALGYPDREFYHVMVIGSESERDDALDTATMDAATREAVEAVDFDESVLVEVFSGPRSSSNVHLWARAEPGGDHLHLHGTVARPSTKPPTSWATCRCSGSTGPPTRSSSSG